MTQFDFVTVDPMQVFETTVPHNGLAYLNAAWKAQGKKVRTIDYAKREYPKDRHTRMVGKTGYFGVTVKTVTYARSQEITKSFDAKAKADGVRGDVKILWGGAHVTDRMETDDPTLKGLPWVFDETSKKAKDRMIAENPEVDIFVPGEAEYWPDNISRRTSLDDLPYPDYSDFDSFENIVDGWRRGHLVWPIITSRGCPYLCSFCEVQRVSGRAWRHRSVENCMDEISSQWSKYRFRQFEVVDDEFNIGRKKGHAPEHAKAFCQGIIELKAADKIPADLPWRCPNGLRADFYDAEFNDLLLQSGCGQVSFGVESLEPSVFKRVVKGETVEEIEATLRLCAERGMPFFGHTIVGLPGSTFEKDLVTLDKLMDITKGGTLGFGTFSILQVMEGTQIAAIAQREGYRDPAIMDNAFFGEHLQVGYWTEEYGKEERMDAFLIFNLCIGNGRTQEFYKSWKLEDARADLLVRIERQKAKLRGGLDRKWWGRIGI